MWGCADVGTRLLHAFLPGAVRIRENDRVPHCDAGLSRPRRHRCGGLPDADGPESGARLGSPWAGSAGVDSAVVPACNDSP